jgi:hypothetical protein
MSIGVLAVDPGASCGVAYLRGGSAASFTMRKPDERKVYDVLFAAKPYVHALVIEGQHVQFHGPKDKNPVLNWPSLESLVLARARWEVIGKLLGMHVEIVLRQTWQGPMLLDAETPTETTKQRAKRSVTRTWSEVTLITDFVGKKGKPRPSARVPSDQRDALLLGRWYQLYGNHRHW